MVDKFTFSAGATLPEIQDSVNPEIAFLTRTESALLALLGFPGGLGKAINVRHEWFEEALRPNSGQVNGAIASGTTALVLDTGHGARFAAGDIIQVDGSRELMSVTSIATDTLTVVRGIRGTTAVAIADNAIVKRINNPAIENETAPGGNPVNRTRRANYTEIFRKVASVTRSMQRVDLHGVDDELEHQVMLARKDIIRDLAHTIINGKKQSSDPEGTASQARTMDGIIQSILAGSTPAIVDAGGASLTETVLNDLLEDMWTKGAQPKVLCAPPQQRRALSALLEGRQRFAPKDKVLGAVVERFVSDFGELDVLAPDIFIPGDCTLVLDPAKLKVMNLGGGSGDPFEVIEIGRTGLATVHEVVGEFTLEIHNAGDGGHGLIHNLAR